MNESRLASKLTGSLLATGTEARPPNLFITSGPWPKQGIRSMYRFLKLLVVSALVAVPWPAGAQDIRINPVPPGVKPQWTQVPGAPQVSWAPNLPTDVFRYRGKYYFFWAGYFYQGPAPEGPWKAMAKVPEVFYKVAPTYFKTAKKVTAAPAEPAPEPPKAKIIEVPPAPPAPAAPEAAPPSAPGPEETTAPPPRVM
jgi:hypothetical protein